MIVSHDDNDPRLYDSMSESSPAIINASRHSALEVFLAFLRLGCISFGGPVAHLSYFREEFVARRGWLNEHSYADLVALCQFLPGPASSQVGIGLGLFRSGLSGAVAAWLGFTLPSAVLLVIFGLLLRQSGLHTDAAWLHGLKVMAVAVVAQAVWAMGRSLCPDRSRATLALLSAMLVSVLPSAWTPIGVIVLGALIGRMWLRPQQALPHAPFPIQFSKRVGVILLTTTIALLIGLPWVAHESGNQAVQLFDRFFRAGALVFGGGHVVLPVLQTEVVAPGWVSNQTFLAGYGAAQAIPGPLFTFAAYLGAVSSALPNGWPGAAIALVAIFLPGFLLVLAMLPLWDVARVHPSMQQAVMGINAAVVGLLLAALYNPVWTSAIHTSADFALALMAFMLLVFWKVPPWLVAIACALAGASGWL